MDCNVKFIFSGVSLWVSQCHSESRVFPLPHPFTSTTILSTMPKFVWPQGHLAILQAAVDAIAAPACKDARAVKRRAIAELRAILPEIDPTTNKKFDADSYIDVSPMITEAKTILTARFQRAKNWINNNSRHRNDRPRQKSSVLKKPGKGVKWSHKYAENNRERVEEEMAKSQEKGPGKWNSVVSRLANELPEEEKEMYKKMAADERDKVPTADQQEK